MRYFIFLIMSLCTLTISSANLPVTFSNAHNDSIYALRDSVYTTWDNNRVNCYA